jgi:Tfp pilus assembly protein PilN
MTTSENTMRELFLDYRRADPAQHRAGIVVLLLSCAVAVALGIHYRNMEVQAARLEVLVAKVEQKVHPGRSLAQPTAANMRQTEAEIKSANEVIMQLSLPWSELFDALEEANSSNIALLGLEPNARKGLVRVSGEAKNSAALFDYIRLLQASKSMSTVYLKHQQVQERDPEKPIRFTLDASWT